MTIEIKAPAFPESVADGVVAAWHKKPGESVARDELLVEIETDKVVMEVVAPAPGVIDAILVSEGETITSEALLATLIEGVVDEGKSQSEDADVAAPATSSMTASSDDVPMGGVVPMGPAVRALLDEHGLDAQQIEASGKGGRLLKEDVIAHLAKRTGTDEGEGKRAPQESPVSSSLTLDVGGPTSE